MTTRWQCTDTARGEEYDARWIPLAEAGENIHGEADLVETLLRESGRNRVLDAGCGTGRVAIELSRRGFVVTGVDADAAMLDAARAKAPEIDWREGDLAGSIDPRVNSLGPGTVDLVLLAGNVMIFLDPGTEGIVLQNLAAQLADNGLLVAGFSLQPGQLSCDRYDEAAAEAGLSRAARWASWDRQPFAGGDYAVTVHRRGVAE
ncbi:MAG: methyltransferase domain-containing protein [Mycobacterium sp.]|nr:methyltransferase domain-containing protein [Mycobacterium sp.]